MLRLNTTFITGYSLPHCFCAPLCSQLVLAAVSTGAIPGEGFNCDLWVMTSGGEKFYQLTELPFQ